MNDTRYIVFANRKGGVGKTVVTFNLAHQLASEGKRVLIVDLDSQGNQTKLCGAKPQDLESFRVGSHVKVTDFISLVPTTKQLGKLEGEINLLFDRNSFIKDDFQPKLPKGFDVVLYDTAPALSLMNTNAFCAADKVVIVVNPDTFSVDGLVETKDILGKVKGINAKLTYNIVMNLFTKRRTLSAAIQASLTKDPGWINVAIPEKQFVKTCVALKDSALADDEVREQFKALAKAVLE